MPSTQGGVNAEEAAVQEVPESIMGPMATVGEETSLIVDQPELQGGVNAEGSPVAEMPEHIGPMWQQGEEETG